MDILKRPMFFASVASAFVAMISVYSFVLAVFIAAFAVLTFIFAVVKGKFKYLPIVIIFLFFVASLLFQFKKINKINLNSGKTFYGEFTVLSEIKDCGKYVTYTLKSNSNDIIPAGTKCFAFDYSGTPLNTGDIISAEIKLNAIKQDSIYRLYDYGNSVYATANVKTVNALNKSDVLYKTAASIRKYIKNTVSSVADGDIAGFLLAVTTGDKSLLSDKFENSIKSTGVSHVVVVSGMHLAIIMSALFFLTDRLFYNKYLRSFISVAAVFAISAVCGFTMSILRAGQMFIIAGLAPVFNRENDSLNSLLAAVTSVLAVSPFSVFNISFQLSVLSTLAIVWVAPFYFQLIVNRFKIKSRVFKVFLSAVLVSVFAMIFTMPIAVKEFGYVSLISPVTNLLITYAVTLVLVLNISGIILSVIPILNILSNCVFGAAKIFASYIVFIINKISKIPVTIAILPQNSYLIFAAVIFAIIAFMYFYNFSKKRRDF